MKTKHTPGPWTVEHDDGHIVSTLATVDCRRGSFIADFDGGLTTEEDGANADLCAAAPELLQACEAALQQLEVLPVPRKSLLNHSITVQMLRAAIAKATGEKDEAL